MYNISVSFKDEPNKIILEFEFKYDYSLEDITIIVKSLLGAYFYGIANGNSITLNDIIMHGFTIADNILNDYNEKKPSLDPVDKIFNVVITPLNIPNTVE